MRKQLLRTIVLLTVLSSGAVLGVAIYFANRSVETLSRSVIEQATEQTESNLEQFFRPIDNQLRTMRQWGEAGMLSLDDGAGFLRMLRPFLTLHPEVTGLILAREDGAELFTLVEEGGFALRYTSPPTGTSKRTVSWTRWRGDKVTATWNEQSDYSPHERPWFKGALRMKDKRQIYWTEPYSFFTTELPGITASASFERNSVGWVVGVDLTLLSVSQFTTGLRITKNGTVAVVTEAGRAIGLPRADAHTTPDAMRTKMLQPIEVIGVPHVREAMARGRRVSRTERGAYRFQSEGAEWWGGLKRFYLNAERPLIVQAAVPEADLIGDLENQRNVILLVISIALVVAIGIAVAMGRHYEQRISAAESEAKQARQLGQYTLEKKIGSGGMGSVYRAKHALLRRPTAVKLLNPKKQDDDALARFELEVQLTAQLTHPNTIAIYDYGRTRDGVFYYAMEYLEGLSLRHLVKRFGPVREARAIHILRQIAGSLDEAHTRGLVHRDIKPANIFLTERGGQLDFAKVLDFGLVERSDDSRRDGERSKRLIVGTPAYMAPEVIRDPERVSPLIDVYSLGCLAYYILTGSPVFRGDDQRSIYKRQLEDTPIPPSSLLKVPLSHEIEELVLSCLHKSPSQRPQSMRDIIRILDHMPLAFAWNEENARDWWEEHLDRREEKERRDLSDAVIDDALESIAIDLQGRSEAVTRRLDVGTINEEFSYPSLSSILGEKSSESSSAPDDHEDAGSARPT